MKRTHILAGILLAIILLSVFAVTSLASDAEVPNTKFTPGCSESNYNIPDSYKDAKFIVFREDGSIYKAQDTLNNALDSAKTLVSTVATSHKTVTILVRCNFEQNAYFSNMGQTLGSVVVDLNGYTLSQSSAALFNAQSKYKDSSYDNAYFLIKNGEIKLNDQGLFKIGAYGTTYDTTNNIYKDMDFEFKNVRISLAEGATLTSLLGFFDDEKTIGRTADKAGYDASSTAGTLSDDFPIAHSQYMGLNVIFNDDCVIDISGAPDGFTLFDANDKTTSDTKRSASSYYWFYTKSVVCVKMYGGNIISDKSDINWYDAAYSLGSNVLFLENDAGEYTRITTTNGAVLDDAFELPTISGKLSISNKNESSNLTTYSFSERNEENNTPGCSEKYYTIPEANANAEIILFRQAGTVYKTYTDLNSALDAAKNLTRTAATRNSTVTVLLRKDVEQTSYCTNMGQGIGNIILDLNGYTLSQSGGTAVFNAEAKYTTYRDDYYVTVKNGNIKLKDAGLFQTGIYGNTYDSDENKYKVENYEFRNVNIFLAENPTISSLIGKFSESSTVGRVPAAETDSSKLTCAHSQRMRLNVIFREDVTIDLRGALDLMRVFDAYDTDIGEDPRSTTLSGVLYHYYPSNSIVNIRVIGGKIISDSIKMVWYKENLDNGSSVTFEADKNGNYTEFSLTNGLSFDQSLKFNPRSNVLVGIKLSEADGDSTYRLYPHDLIDVPFSIKTSVILNSELVYKIYIPKSESLVALSVDSETYTDFNALTTEEINGTDHYMITISLPAATAAREIKLSANILSSGMTLTKQFTLGIPKYVSRILASENATDIERILVGDVLSYIKAAYEYFDGSDENDIKRIDAVLDKDHNLMSLVNYAGDAPSGNIGLKYATFVLDGAPKIRFYTADDNSLSDYSFKINGVSIPRAAEGSDSYGKYIDLSVYAYNLAKTFDCYINGAYSGSYNIKSYYSYVTSSEETKNDTALITLAERLWKYSQSAENYHREKLGETIEHEHYFIERSFEMTSTNPKYDERICACGYGEKTMHTGIDDGTKPLKVLFIGNSSTYYNDMPSMFYNIAVSSGINLSVTSVTKGGWTMAKFMDPTDSGGKLVAEAFANDDYDYVFLQDYTTHSTLKRTSFYTGIRGVAAIAEADGAKVILYHGIARPDEHEFYTESGDAYGYNTESFIKSCAGAHEAIAEEMGYALSRGGTAFLYVYQNYRDKITLYASDNAHPSAEASYAIALTHFATLFGRSPIGIEYTAGFDAETAAILQEAAYRAVYGESIVTDEYKTSSVGIGKYPNA